MFPFTGSDLLHVEISRFPLNIIWFKAVNRKLALLVTCLHGASVAVFVHEKKFNLVHRSNRRSDSLYIVMI